jgi:broad specificity phosphatase PhoE
MEPIADALGLPVSIDGRVIEAANYLEGLKFSFPGLLRRPKLWWHFRNVFGPSWGERYRDIVARMRLAMRDAADAAAGHEAVIVSHQLPIWITRLHVEGHMFLHDPRRRQCTLCSLTSLTFVNDHLTMVRYSEPAADLIPFKDRSAPFSSGGAPKEDKPPVAGA